MSNLELSTALEDLPKFIGFAAIKIDDTLSALSTATEGSGGLFFSSFTTC